MTCRPVRSSPPWASLDSPQRSSNAASPRSAGQRITGVDYALLTGGTDGHAVLDWDYDTRHEPTVGIQLTTEIGAVFTLTWASSFGYYALQSQ